MPLFTYVTTYATSKGLNFKTFRDELPRFYLASWKYARPPSRSVRRQQALHQAPLARRPAGFSLRQRSIAIGQRGWKRQPGGMLAGSG